MASRIPASIVREREQRAWQLSAGGKSQAEIAAELGVSQPAVSHILKRVSYRVQAEMTEAIARSKVQQAARLDHVYSQAMTAWEESRKPRSLSRRRRRTAAGGAALEEETVNQAETTAGDPAFLMAALEALAGKRKLLGLDAPKRIDHRVAEETTRPLQHLSDDELKQLLVEQQAQLECERQAERQAAERQFRLMKSQTPH